jgi:hypothetical protein
VLVGAIWTVRASLAFDVGVRGARVDDDCAAEARAGLTWAIPFGPLGGSAATPQGSRAVSRHF